MNLALGDTVYIEAKVDVDGCLAPVLKSGKGLGGHVTPSVCVWLTEEALLAKGTRCWSCDHTWDIHQPEGCWYTVDQGRSGENLVCPCSVPRGTEAAAQPQPPLLNTGVVVQLGDKPEPWVISYWSAQYSPVASAQITLRRPQGTEERVQESRGDKPRNWHGDLLTIFRAHQIDWRNKCHCGWEPHERLVTFDERADAADDHVADRIIQDLCLIELEPGADEPHRQALASLLKITNTTRWTALMDATSALIEDRDELREEVRKVQVERDGLRQSCRGYQMLFDEIREATGTGPEAPDEPPIDLRSLRTIITEMREERDDLNQRALVLAGILRESMRLSYIWHERARSAVMEPVRLAWTTAEQELMLAGTNLPSSSTLLVLDEVGAERLRQDEKWGEQNHPDGTGNGTFSMLADAVRDWCQKAFAQGKGTWAHVLLEKVAEALAEEEAPNLRAELVQVSAVGAAWIEAIDRRTVAND